MPTNRPLRILVVDDDPAMVGAITALVGTEGHQVITAYDGLTAVRRFHEDHPDLVLLDLAMPGPDGFTVAGQIRAAGEAPIIVVSGESSEGGEGEGARNRGGRLPRQAIRACRAPGADRGGHATGGPDRGGRSRRSRHVRGAGAGPGAPRGAGRRDAP